MGLALTGRRTRRSNLLPADLSLTPVTSLSMLLGTHSLAAFKQLELFWVYNIFVEWIKTVLVNVISRHISA
ncbi:inner membrane protein [Salmonella enterica subsp. enterica serovar Bovismorbificans]|nr:inner membrane protein [Salmonella enterica subsp. enterica serovar Bovismorbificans]